MIYSMVVLELAFATMGSSVIVVFDGLLIRTGASLTNGRFVALLRRARSDIHVGIAIDVSYRCFVCPYFRGIVARKFYDY